MLLTVNAPVTQPFSVNDETRGTAEGPFFGAGLPQGALQLRHFSRGGRSYASSSRHPGRRHHGHVIRHRICSCRVASPHVGEA